MHRPSSRVALLFVFVVGAAVGADRGEVSRAIEERLGHGLASERSPDVTSRRFPQNVDLTDGLTEEEAVSLALWNNAALQATLADLGLAQAELLEAGLLVNPSFQMLVGLGSKPFEFLLIAPIEALWQRPKRMAAAELNLQSVAEQLVQNGLDLVRDTRLAYADYRMFDEQAKRASGVADLAEEIAELDAKQNAKRPLLDLRLREAVAEAAVARARAELDRAVGRKL